MRKTYKGLIKHRSNYYMWVGKMEKELEAKVKFEFGIEHQASDGICILNNNTSQLALLNECITIIESEGELTEEMHDKISI